MTSILTPEDVCGQAMEQRVSFAKQWVFQAETVASQAWKQNRKDPIPGTTLGQCNQSVGYPEVRVERLTATISQKDLGSQDNKLKIYPEGNREPLIGLCPHSCETE